MQARHFLSGRGRPSSSAIQSNNCFITGPSRKSFVASIAPACSGGKSVSRGGIYLFFLPDSFRDVLSLSIYHCSQKSQPLTIAFSTCARSRRDTFVLFSEKAKATRRLFCSSAAPLQRLTDLRRVTMPVTLYGQGWETISTIIAPLSSPTFFEKLFMSSARALGFVSAQKACAIGVATKSERPTLSTSQKRSVTEAS